MSKAATHHEAGASLIPRSGNRKLGGLAATRAAKASCPSACPMREACYGDRSFTGIHWKALSKGRESMRPVDIARSEARAILRAWPRDGRGLRLHEAGDCRTTPAARVVADAVRIAQSEGAGPAYTYSHAWRWIPREAWGSISVLASCEDGAGVERAFDRGYAAARVVDDFEGVRDSRGIPCPAQTRGLTCAECKLCMRDSLLLKLRRAILFRPHGSGASAARRVVR